MAQSACQSNLFVGLCISPVDTELVKFVQTRWCETLLTEDLGLEPVWSHLAKLIVHMLARWNGENVVKF